VILVKEIDTPFQAIKGGNRPTESVAQERVVFGAEPQEIKAPALLHPLVLVHTCPGPVPFIGLGPCPLLHQVPVVGSALFLGSSPSLYSYRVGPLAPLQ
jgi:hypothetical protein